MFGCGGGNPNGGVPGAGSRDEDPVTVDGSSTVYRISTAAQEGFAKVDSKVEVVVGNSGTGGGFTKYLRDEIDVVDASRLAKPEEESKAKAQGIDWLKFVVGYDGITVVVNPKNDFVNELSVEQLKRLFEPDSKVKTWKDLDPSWPAREIKLYTPDDKSGTFEFFTEAIVGKPKSQRKGVQASSRRQHSGPWGRGRRRRNRPLRLRSLQGVFPRSCLRDPDRERQGRARRRAPSPETILSKAYSPVVPCPLFIYVKKKSYRRPNVAAFVKYYLRKRRRTGHTGQVRCPDSGRRKTNEAEAKSAEGKPLLEGDFGAPSN